MQLIESLVLEFEGVGVVGQVLREVGLVDDLDHAGRRLLSRCGVGGPGSVGGWGGGVGGWGCGVGGWGGVGSVGPRTIGGPVGRGLVCGGWARGSGRGVGDRSVGL